MHEVADTGRGSGPEDEAVPRVYEAGREGWINQFHEDGVEAHAGEVGGEELGSLLVVPVLTVLRVATRNLVGVVVAGGNEGIEWVLRGGHVGRSETGSGRPWVLGCRRL